MSKHVCLAWGTSPYKERAEFLNNIWRGSRLSGAETGASNVSPALERSIFSSFLQHRWTSRGFCNNNTKPTTLSGVRLWQQELMEDKELGFKQSVLPPVEKDGLIASTDPDVTEENLSVSIMCFLLRTGEKSWVILQKRESRICFQLSLSVFLSR